MDEPRSRALVRLLQAAYSGERAAALAYSGHWRSLPPSREREQVRAIEADEWHHRTRVGEMLVGLGAKPSALAELRASMFGRTLGLACHVTGRLLPMWAAGRLESRNVVEYERAARLARDGSRLDWADELLGMAEVEWDHEQTFRAIVLAHPLGRRLPIWPAPAPRGAIRALFERPALDQHSSFCSSP